MEHFYVLFALWNSFSFDRCAFFYYILNIFIFPALLYLNLYLYIFFGSMFCQVLHVSLWNILNLSAFQFSNFLDMLNNTAWMVVHDIYTLFYD